MQEFLSPEGFLYRPASPISESFYEPSMYASNQYLSVHCLMTALGPAAPGLNQYHRPKRGEFRSITDMC